jgi:hypothetical protein
MGTWGTWGRWGLDGDIGDLWQFFIGVEHMDILKHGDIRIWSMGRWGY